MFLIWPDLLLGPWFERLRAWWRRRGAAVTGERAA
jgi:hypothetical protein